MTRGRRDVKLGKPELDFAVTGVSNSIFGGFIQALYKGSFAKSSACPKRLCLPQNQNACCSG